MREFGEKVKKIQRLAEIMGECQEKTRNSKKTAMRILKRDPKTRIKLPVKLKMIFHMITNRVRK